MRVPIKHITGAAVALMAATSAATARAAPTEVATTSYSNGVQTITYGLWNAGSNVTWEAADADAMSSGLQLASEHSDAEAVAIGSLAADYPTAGGGSSAYTVDGANNEEGPYIGGYRIAPGSSEPFAWSDGSAFDYTNWNTSPPEPDDYGGTENYINLFSGGSAPIVGPLSSASDRGAQWNDVGENATPFYVTESVATTVSAAPEPSTWAMMLAGIGGIGLAFRWAKRKVASLGDAFAV